jgi:lipopolysaccharide heptosyltransferase II
MSKLGGLGNVAVGDGSRMLRILVVRPDRIGDVLLSTPVFEVIKRHYPNSKLTILVQAQMKPLLEGLPFIDEIMIFDPSGKHAGVGGFFRLLREVRVKRFRIAVVLQSSFKIAAAVFFGRVRYRIGPLSKPHSFLFFNRGVRQGRSQVEMHEADYNLQLLRRLGIRAGARHIQTAAYVSTEDRIAAQTFLQQRGWSESEPLVVVHPGMGGSALNWPESHYMDLIRALLREGRRVIVTGGPTEAALLQRISDSLGPLRDKLTVYCAAPGQGMGFLAGIMSWASVVVAPSTGPLHLAVALKKPVVTFYPPIRVQSAIRWGPYLRDEKQASVMVPEIYCGEDFKCRGNLCNHFPCMKTITVAEAIEKVKFQLENHS